jgi:hypothetical protein
MVPNRAEQILTNIHPAKLCRFLHHAIQVALRDSHRDLCANCFTAPIARTNAFYTTALSKSQMKRWLVSNQTKFLTKRKWGPKPFPHPLSLLKWDSHSTDEGVLRTDCLLRRRHRFWWKSRDLEIFEIKFKSKYKQDSVNTNSEIPDRVKICTGTWIELHQNCWGTYVRRWLFMKWSEPGQTFSSRKWNKDLKKWGELYGDHVVFSWLSQPTVKLQSTKTFHSAKCFGRYAKLTWSCQRRWPEPSHSRICHCIWQQFAIPSRCHNNHDLDERPMAALVMARPSPQQN